MTTGDCLDAVATGEAGTAAGPAVGAGAAAVGIAAFVAAAGAVGVGALAALGGVAAGALTCAADAVPNSDGLPVWTSHRSHNRNSDMPKKTHRTVRWKSVPMKGGVPG